MQTNEQINAEIQKLNHRQRVTLRRKFANRTITELHVDTEIDHVTVTFSGVSTHFFYLGPRGGIKHHTPARAI